MTVSRPCYFGNLLLGVVGVDVNLAYILEDVTYYQDSLASYTFLIDNKGRSLTRIVLIDATVHVIVAAKKGVNSCGTGYQSAKSFTTCGRLQLQLLQLHD